MQRYFIITLLALSLLGMFDASYLTFEHYSHALPPCSNSVWVDCGRVLKSKYAMVGSLPLSVLGLFFYSSMLSLAIVRLTVEKKMTIKDVLWNLVEKYARPHAWSLEQILFFIQLLSTLIAATMSSYLVYLQLGVIHAICLYCMLSATLSYVMLIITVIEYFRVKKTDWLIS